MKFLRNKKAQAKKANQVHQLETLEPRKLLTTLVGGDIFEFVDANRQVVHVIVQGDAMVELIGAGVDPNDSTLYLDHLPGVFRQSDLGYTDHVVTATNSPVTVNELFAIYVSQSSANASIIVSVYKPDSDPQDPGNAYYLPFSGTTFDAAADPTTADPYTLVNTDDAQYNLFVTLADGQAGQFITFPSGIGGAYIGARGYVDDDNDPTTASLPRAPIIEGSLARLGLRAEGVDQLLYSDTNNVSAGVEVAPGLLDYVRTGLTFDEYLIGGDLNRGQGLAIDSNGTIVTIDTDQRQTGGGDGLVFINSDGTYDSELPISSSGIQAIAFGDLYYSGNEQLWAVRFDNVNYVIGTIDITTGAFTQQATLAGISQNVNSMAFAPFASRFSPNPQQALYLVTEDNRLLEVDPLTGNILTNDAIASSGGETIAAGSMFFGPSSQLYVQDLFNGRLMSLSLQGQNSGQVLAGATLATSNGSLRPTVGGLAYDAINNRFLAIDNAPAAYYDAAPVAMSFIRPSAALMSLRGLSNSTDTHQDLQRLRIGGIVTGKVAVSGSLDQFYAGVVLTGQAAGQPGGTTPDIAGNFYIGGDLREMIVATSIGANTTPAGGYSNGFAGMYVTGFDMVVRGKVGYIRMGDSFVGSLDVGNLDSAPHRTLADASLVELEAKPFGNIADNLFESDYFTGSDMQLYQAGGLYFNDSFDTPQRLGSLRTGVANQPDAIRVSGTLDDFANAPDFVDYYSVFLCAGQVVTVTLNTGFLSTSLRVGIFDPDHRLIDTDQSAVNPDVVAGQPITFRADRPGEYRFAVGKEYDPLFDGNSLTLVGETGYTLIIEGAGDLALGAIAAGQHILVMDPGDTAAPDGQATPGGIRAIQGDIGGIVSGGRQLYFTYDTYSVAVNNGNLRGMVAEALGTFINTFTAFTPVLAVPQGHIGLLKTSGDLLYFNTPIGVNIGGNIQTIDAADLFSGVFSANGGVGVIRAGRVDMMGGSSANFWTVNADGIGADGIIDLIDVAGDFGTFNFGGPAIVTGPGGNVRYMRVGGQIYQDSMYGGGSPTTLTLAPGQSHTHIDDSGARVILAPNSRTSSLSVTRYGIRGSGGSVLVNVTSSDLGIKIVSTSTGSVGSIEIGQIVNNGQLASVLISGPLPVNILQLDGGAFKNILNQSGGEIVGVNATSITKIYTVGTLGLARSSTGAIVNPRSVVANTYPFLDQRFGIVAGSIGYIGAEKGLGNIIVSGNIDQLVANPTGVRGANEFRGIVAPVYAGGNILVANIGEGIAPSRRGAVSQAGLYAGGFINRVVGQNAGSIIRGDIVASGGINSISLVNGTIANATIASYTSLDMAQPQVGTYVASSDIGSIYLSGRGGMLGVNIAGGNIGNISVANGGFGLLNSMLSTTGSGNIGNIIADGYGIQNVTLWGGASAGNIYATGRGQMLQATRYMPAVRLSENFSQDPLFFEHVNILNDLHLALQPATAQLLPENVQVGDRFTITVSDGAGASASVSYVATSADPYNVVAGLINAWNAASQNPLIGSISASAPLGAFLQLQALSPQAAFLISTSTVNGGNANTQTLKVRSNRMAGVISNVDARGSNTLGKVIGYRIDNSMFNYANSIAGIYTAASVDWNPFTVDGLQLTTGAISAVKILGSARNFQATVAGLIQSVDIRGDFGDRDDAGEYSYLNLTGASGIIIDLFVGGNLIGDIFASSKVGTVRIGGDMVGDLNVDALNVPATKYALGTLRLNGNLQGSINVASNVGTIISAGSLGVAGDQLRINGNLGALYVGADASRNGNILGTDLIVQGNLGILDVRGAIQGDVFVGGDLGSMNLRADSASINAAILDSSFVVGRDLRAATLTNGNLGDGVNQRQIVAGRHIGILSLVNGSINTGSAVQSMLGDIGKITIRNGSVLGDILADAGSIGSLVVVGSDLGGRIEADTAGTISFAGSMLSTAALEINRLASVVSFGRNVEAGATINLGAADRLSVGGNLAGTFDIGYSSNGTVITIGGNLALASSNEVDANTRMTVGGSVYKDSEDGRLYIGRNLVQLAVAGSMTGDVIVKGAASAISAASLSDSVITTGLDLSALSIAGAMNNSLVQSGLRPGADTNFADSESAKDFGEESQLGGMGTVRVGSMTNSIIASGAGINALVSGAMTRSSVSAGLSLGSLAVRQVLDDDSRLADETELNAARSGDDQVLLRGDITSAAIGGTGLTDSFLTAGVSPGGNGDFADPSVVDSATGGISRVVSARGILGAGSRVVADAPIVANNLTLAGGIIDDNVAYTIDHITDDLGASLENLLGTATAGTPFVASNILGTFRVALTGPGTVSVYDNDPSDGVIDAIRLTGTTSSTAVTVTGSGAFSINRILGEDDLALGRLVFDGDLLGEGTEAPDLWLDGSVGALTIRNLGDNVNGQIGGNVGAMTMNTQGSGLLIVGGSISTLSIQNASQSPLVANMGNYAGYVFNTLATDDAGQTWAHAGGVLYQVDPATSAPGGILSSINLTDSLTGQPLTSLLGMDYAGSMLGGIARLYDPNPTQTVGSINTSPATLRGLAVSASGNVYAIDSASGQDQLVQINTATGASTVIGTLYNPVGGGNYVQNVLALSFNSAGQLLALVNDRDGTGPFDLPANGVALVQIQTADSDSDGRVNVTRIGNPIQKGVFLNDGGAVTDNFTALAVHANGDLYAIRRSGGTQDDLVRINATTGAVTLLGQVQVSGQGTNIVGMGFDENGNLVALDNDGVSARLIFLASAQLNTPDQAQDLSVAAPLAAGLDAFAIGRSGTHYRTFAFDTDGNGTFYANPVDASDPEGRVLVMGLIDPATGVFTRVITPSDASGIIPSLPAGRTSLPLTVDNTQANPQGYFIDGSNQLIQVDLVTLQTTIVGTITDNAMGQTVALSALEFNENTGLLIGLDTVQGRVFSVDPATAAAAQQSEAGLVGTGLVDLAYDVLNEQMIGYVVDGANSAANQFVQFKDTVGGIIATSVSNLRIGPGSYTGRVVATGNTLGAVTVTGDFRGSLASAGNINSFVQTGGVFAGNLTVAGDVNTLVLANAVQSTALIEIGGQLASFTHKSGPFAGRLDAATAATIVIAGDLASTGVVQTADKLTTLRVGGNLHGRIAIGGSTDAVRIVGLTTGSLEVDGNAGTLAQNGGVNASSTTVVNGSLSTYAAGGTHRGQLFVRRGITSAASFVNVNSALIAAGLDANKVAVTGSVIDSLFSIGTWVGDDLIFNTADDLITGGSLARMDVAGNFTDSVVAAGVLPDVAYGPGRPTDNRAYLAHTQGGTRVDDLQAGGLLRSYIQVLVIKGQVFTTQPNGARQSVAVAADGITATYLPAATGAALTQVTYGDPIGAPQIFSNSIELINQSTVRLYFTEPINSASLTLAQTVDGPGSVLVLLDGQIVTDAQLLYSVRTLSDGSVQGVLTITRSGGFNGNVLDVTLRGTGESPIVDRSGLRSMLRQIGDPLQTILDGKDNGYEGSDFNGMVILVDAPDDFAATTLPPIPLILDGSPVVQVQTIASNTDVDVYRLNGLSGQLLGVQVATPSGTPLSMAIFYRDTRGTVDPLDDLFKVLARYEDNVYGPASLFQAVELPLDTEYFVAIESAFGQDPVGSGNYAVTLTLASDEANLVNQFNATSLGNGVLQLQDGTIRQIGYISNHLRNSKQLVYVNFDGGISTLTSEGTLTFTSFDPVVLDAQLAGQRDAVIAGIMQNILSIYNTLPVGANITAQYLDVSNATDWAAYQSATTGLYFTTVNPSTAQGLDQYADFITIFVGQTTGGAGYYGLASDISMAGMTSGHEALVFAQNFAGGSTASTTNDLMNEYALALANTSAHELGHTLGLNHQPTTYDPMECLLLIGGPNAGQPGLMTYPPPSVDFTQLELLGLNRITPSEFSVPVTTDVFSSTTLIDTAELLYWWFA